NILLFNFLFLFVCDYSFSQNSDRVVNVNLRGVYEAKLMIIPLEGVRATSPIAIAEKVKNGNTVKLVIPAKYIPGEFIIRADYISKQGDNPYPSEKSIIVFNQDLEIFMHPMYMNNKDSTYFALGERENTINEYFKTENIKKRAQLELLKNFLLNYDKSSISLFKKVAKEFEKKRKVYNEWLKKQAEIYKDLFVSRTFQFQYMPPVNWAGDEKDRIIALIKNYFDGINFNDSLLIRTSEIDRFMNTYMGLYGSMATTMELRDSLFTLAGSIACEKASKGHPYVYGWMVDYFNNGYKMYDIKAGIDMLQKHINNPNCLTAKKREISRRIEKMTNLKAGNLAPDFTLKDSTGKEFNFYTWKGKGKETLLFIWSADCGHCIQKVSELKEWYNKNNNKNKIDIIAVSIDETEIEKNKWEEAKKTLHGWVHLRAEGGVNSLFAYDYAILATPVILLVDNDTHIIKSVITEIQELDSIINN
ncbi:MAG TPA: redoxin domain-containing protein, partial [Bacteroidales bacterium]|nr:redoxin domain-containing protein [Bacteroidales bacterium]